MLVGCTYSGFPLSIESIEKVSKSVSKTWKSIEIGQICLKYWKSMEILNQWFSKWSISTPRGQ